MAGPAVKVFRDFMESGNAEQYLVETGMVSENIIGGIQFNVTSAKGVTGPEVTVCDHCCTSPPGGYSCNAAAGRNRSVSGTFAPADKILEGIERSAEAIRSSKEYFIGKGFFRSYARESMLPETVAGALKSILDRNDTVEVNLFGGNPELHDGLIDIIRGLNRPGYCINLTTTGRRVMLDDGFSRELLSCRPDVIALSADTFMDAGQILRLGSCSLEEIRSLWEDVPKNFGQMQKALEAAWAAKFLEGSGVDRMFNLVVHNGNLPVIYDIIAALTKSFPGVKLNPYPAQSSFYNGAPVFDRRELALFRDFVGFMIKRQRRQIGDREKTFMQALPYWTMLESLYGKYGDHGRLSRSLSGYAAWKCHRAPGPLRYMQIGISPRPTKSETIAGGHPGCFWDEGGSTVTMDRQVWSMGAEEIRRYIVEGAAAMAKQNPSACQGCLMPRLASLDEIVLFTGMDPGLRRAYIGNRIKNIGF